MTYDNATPEVREAVVAEAMTHLFHRGDRVVSQTTGQHGVVEGWKSDRVYVWWGTFDRTPVRSWVPTADVVMADDQPGYPKQAEQ